jgi:hypothetical protein
MSRNLLEMVASEGRSVLEVDMMRCALVVLMIDDQYAIDAAMGDGVGG